MALPYLKVITHYECLVLPGSTIEEHQIGVLVIKTKNSLEERASRKIVYITI